MKIGILGGSFNPPHKMHKKIAIELIQKKYVDKIIFVPTGDAYPKAYLAKAKDRYEMVKRMIEGDKNLEVSDFECRKEHKYTYETIQYFQEKYKKDTIYFIVGFDNLKELPTWKNYDFLKTVPFLALDRNEESVEKLIEERNYTNITPCKVPTKNISSTQIRQKIREGKNCQKSISPKVYNYIEEKHLYTN